MLNSNYMTILVARHFSETPRNAKITINEFFLLAIVSEVPLIHIVGTQQNEKKELTLISKEII